MQNGRTALHLACEAKDFENLDVEDYLPAVKLLLEKGADVSICDEVWYALCVSADRHCSLSLSIQDGCSPLMVASRHGDISMVRILIEEGAHVNTQNKVMMLSQH